MKCRVLRSFPGPGGRKLQIGELVDTTEWRNREALIAQRYIQPARLSSGFERKPVEGEEPFRPSKTVAKTAPLKKKKKLLAEV